MNKKKLDLYRRRIIIKRTKEMEKDLDDRKGSIIEKKIPILILKLMIN